MFNSYSIASHIKAIISLLTVLFSTKSVTVNGKKFVGPGRVFRKWPLRGVALCPYGADNQTSVNVALEDEVVSVLFLNSKEGKETDMSKEKEKKEVPDVKSEEKVKDEKKMEDQDNKEQGSGKDDLEEKIEVISFTKKYNDIVKLISKKYNVTKLYEDFNGFD